MNKVQSILVICFGLILVTTLEAKSTVTTVPLNGLGLNSTTIQTLVDGTDLYIGSTEVDDSNCGASKLYRVNAAGELKSIDLSSISGCIDKILKNETTGAIVLQVSAMREGFFAPTEADDTLISISFDENDTASFSDAGLNTRIDKLLTAKRNNQSIFYIFNSDYYGEKQLYSYIDPSLKLLTESTKLVDVAIAPDKKTVIEAYSCGIQTVRYIGGKRKFISYPLAGEKFCTHVNNSPLSTQIGDIKVIDKYLFYSTYIPEEDSDSYYYVKDLSNNKKQYIAESLYFDSIHLYNDYIYTLNKYNGVFRKRGIFSKKNSGSVQLLDDAAVRSLTLLSQSGNKLILLQDASIYGAELSFTNSPDIDVVVYLLQ